MTDINALRRRLDALLPDGIAAESVFDYLPYVKDEQIRRKLEDLFHGYYRVRFRGDTPEAKLIEEVRRFAHTSVNRLRTSPSVE